ncbi:MAG: hypothetical protein M3O50_07935 [Myxococcota bacterium]|nr:hypothetical protein [Myxococcota bacterium]
MTSRGVPAGIASAARAASGIGLSALLFAFPAHAECVETGAAAERPQMIDSFPARGTSGYAATLHVVVSHGRGETVLPRGLELQSDGEAARILKASGFLLPDQDSGSAARLSSADTDAKGGRRQTTLDLPLVALPSEGGRHTLVLPPLPVSVARANNDVVTLCTKAHTIVVDDPTASTPDAQPKSNPPARLQREEWVALERALAWTAAGAVVGSLVAWLVRRRQKRPKPVGAPPVPRAAWVIALERLDEARHAGLLETQRFSEFFDRVNDAVREYLGARFGFEGLESTTDETLAALRRVAHFALPLPEVAAFLQECDLVKFADVTPALEECERALAEAEKVVRATMPTATRVAFSETTSEARARQ